MNQSRRGVLAQSLDQYHTINGSALARMECAICDAHRSRSAVHSTRRCCAVLLLVAVLSFVAYAAPPGPEPPCGGPPRPPYPDLGAAPHTQVWSAGDLAEGWAPMACLGWNASGFRTLVALAGWVQPRPGP